MSRSFQQILANTTVMLDVNVLVYALTPAAHLHIPCRDLRERGVRGDIVLKTSVSVVADVTHRAFVYPCSGGM
ncbi:MAG: hypothetical protein ACLFVO_04265 [Chloroflexaceae bacterium]